MRGPQREYMSERAVGPPPYWVDKQGRVLSVSRMQTDHIKVCIARIHRLQGKWRLDCLPMLYRELYRRALG